MSILYGPQTKQALQNFPFPFHSVHLDLIYAITEVKEAAALANAEAETLDTDIAQAIVLSCQEVREGMFDDQFPTCALQGGAGTSINMNVNEVLATRVQEVLSEQGKTITVHPNDHVNMSQSTNDVNPSALRIVCIRLTASLVASLNNLVTELEKKAEEFKDVHKLGRTHIQDAVPTTLGEEMKSYAATLRRSLHRIQESSEYLPDLNLGGTAIGNSINASPDYIHAVYEQLRNITGMELRKAENLMSGTSSAGDFCNLSSVILDLCTDLSKIAKDLRVLSGGPKGGMGEISLEALQPGSSIMPGKVNPVMPEAVNQLYYLVSGLNVTVHQAAHGANLELNVMFPIIADSIITMLKVTQSVVQTFTDTCIVTMQANEERCRETLERSSAYATLLTPRLGYDVVSAVVKESVESGKSLREVVSEKELLTEEEFERIVRN